MTTYEALSLIVQTSISLLTGLAFIVTIVVLLNKKK
ncbi:putative holin-like toxin [Oceanobacillus sp. Castelsardo]|nr:putative holin-like toxin [Oceanobacillus sp. Castelsardo]